MDAVIITIGEEILIGQIVDTNSAWMAQELNAIGVKVRKIISISDSAEQIKNSINQAIDKTDVVLVTGGLGPTTDDITKQTLAQMFGGELLVHEPTLEHIREIFAKRGLPLTNLNAKQAQVPSSCEVLHNPLGTAPGMWFNTNGKVIVAMPGVPFEMKEIMRQHVLPRLGAVSSTNSIVHKTIHTFGLPESFLAEKLTKWESEMPKDIAVAYLPNPLSIRIRISSSGSNRSLIQQNINDQIVKLKQIIPESIFGYDEDSMASVVGNMLSSQRLKLSLAESCTGGTIAHLVTQLSGSSKYFMGGVVAYSNEAKINLLEVDSKLIDSNGAVSQQVVEAMAQGAMKKFDTDYVIATSGIAGPTGATPGKPVGTIWIAVASKNQTISKLYTFGNDRERNILRSSVTALNMLRLLIISEKNF